MSDPVSLGPVLSIPGEDNDYHNLFIIQVADSFARLTGRPLEGLDPAAPGRSAYFADFALLTHRGGPAAMLNYGNRFALKLWDCDWAAFVAMPSANTAPDDAGLARARMMEKVARDNFVTGYSGLRISATGRLFRIRDATVWRLKDAAGNAFGVGATFRDYEYL